MTPDEAQDLLDKIKGTDAAALQAHMDWKDVSVALTTIAEMRYEYAVQVVRDGVWVMDGDSYWGSYSVALVRYGRAEGPARIVRRLMSDVEVVE